MIETSADILNIVLSIGFGVLATLLAVVLVQCIFILRDLGEASRLLRRTAEMIQEMVVQPLQLVKTVLQTVLEFASMFGLFGGEPEPKPKPGKKKK